MTLTLILCIAIAQSQDIYLSSQGQLIQAASKGQRDESFYQYQQYLDCGMPPLFTLPDASHDDYEIIGEGAIVYSVTAKWSQIQAVIKIDGSNCKVAMNNLCEGASSQINWIKLATSIGDIEYLVNCEPSSFYKPFEIGLFLLILFCTVVIGLSSKYSKAWSYGGYGYEITRIGVVFFNVAVFLAMTLGYMFPTLTALSAQVFGTVIGAAGVTVCVSESLWLVATRTLKNAIFKRLRLLDLISISIGLSYMPIYWFSNGHWLINDIMAVSCIVALMKLLKIKSLSLCVFLLVSLLIQEAIVGVVVHYVLHLSYNNYIINTFQNPIILVIPSITPQLYRSCAWLPITSVLLPGLLLSYLRRFDHSRSTMVYFIIGLVSFYIGSALWMVVDLETVHSLPFAIISEPVTIFIVCLQSYRRNEFMIIWRGTFYDE